MKSDLIVVGGGGIGLAVALAAAERGLTVSLVAEHRSGEAFPAAAGMLAPASLEMVHHAASGTEHAFSIAARDRFPDYLAKLAEVSGITVPLNRLGILHVVLDEAEAARHASVSIPGATWLDRRALTTLEPTLGHAAGAMLFADDGAVDNVVLYTALQMAVARSARVRQTDARAVRVAIERDGVRCELANGDKVAGAEIVLAAGAWSRLIDGLPRPVPVEPLRGQMISLSASPLRHVVYGDHGYLVPRGDLSLVGATQERVGYEVSTTPDGIKGLSEAARELCPELAQATMASAWAGLRPVTPDFLPILGRDPDYPSLIYACGHSRNGVLMAPLTGDCIAALAAGEEPPVSLSAFGIERFEITVEAAATG